MAKKAQADQDAGTPAAEPKEPAAAPEAKEPKKPKPPKAKAPDGAPAEGAAAPAAEQSSKKRGKQPGVSPHRGKKLRNHLKNQLQKVLKDGPFPVKKALGLLKSMKRAKFDETVEVHMSLGIDTTQSDQMVRGSVSLPHGIGKSVRVIVFCQGENVAKAKDAGADYAGGQDLVDKIQKENWLEFDVALATQDMMGMASRLGKVLGPRGLMPTPKAGTVVPANADIAGAVREFKAGKVEYRADKGGNVHAGVGKMSFDEAKLADNVTAFIDQVKNAKPTGVKGNYIKKVTLSATMSPGVPVSV
jgi:large subunit ribosomal protein L1